MTSFPCVNCSSKVVHPDRKCINKHIALRRFLSPSCDQKVAAFIDKLSNEVVEFVESKLDSPEYLSAVSHGASSAEFQNIIAPILMRYGFESEKGQKVIEAAFKPDFLLRGRDFCIMVEVERGKTLDNNMDMLDLWKCHIHAEANHLILMVPIWYVKQGKNPSRTPTYMRVCRRMAPFFEAGNETNVHSLHVIGY